MMCDELGKVHIWVRSLWKGKVLDESGVEGCEVREPFE